MIGMVVFIPIGEVKANDSWEEEYHNDSPTNYAKVFLNADEDYSHLGNHIGTGMQTTSIYNIEFAPQTIQDFTNPIGEDLEWHDFGDVNLGVRIGNYQMNDVNYGRSFFITLFYHISDENSDHPRDLDSLATRIIADIDDSDGSAGFYHMAGDENYIGGTNIEQLKSNIDLKEVYSDMTKDTFENVITTVSPTAAVLAHTRDMISYLDPDQYAPFYDATDRTGFIDRTSDQAPLLDYDSDTEFDEGFRYMDFYETYLFNFPEDEEEFSISVSLSDADCGTGYSPWADQRSYGSYMIDFEVSDCYGCLDGSCDCSGGGGSGGGGGAPVHPTGGGTG
ncbi:MAG: hypothetical protein ACOC53_08390 [Candidatus Saliniplasma sp.]